LAWDAGYSCHMPNAPSQATPSDAQETADELNTAARAERAQRIAAMLDRWAAEDCSGEPDWDPDDIPPFRLGVPAQPEERGDRR
jgi:hypothetical protein